MYIFIIITIITIISKTKLLFNLEIKIYELLKILFIYLKKKNKIINLNLTILLYIKQKLFISFNLIKWKIFYNT